MKLFIDVTTLTVVYSLLGLVRYTSMFCTTLFGVEDISSLEKDIKKMLVGWLLCSVKWVEPSRVESSIPCHATTTSGTHTWYHYHRRCSAVTAVVLSLAELLHLSLITPPATSHQPPSLMLHESHEHFVRVLPRREQLTDLQESRILTGEWRTNSWTATNWC